MNHVQWGHTLTALVLHVIMFCKEFPGCNLQDGGKAVQLDQKIVEAYFVFACIWAFGGCLAVEKSADHRALFSQYWVMEWKTVTFPNQVPGIPHGRSAFHSKPRLQSLPVKLSLAH